MTENSQVTTSSPPSFSSELHDTKPVTISGGHGSHEAYPFTPTTYASASYPASAALTTTAYLTPGNVTITESVGYNRNGMQHHRTGFPPELPPTPQDYPISMGRYSNGNNLGLPPNSNVNTPKSSPGQQRPSTVPTLQAMMTTFSLKTVSSTQRYKCNICQKMFTRPSSLQTHMYSHTGEKPFKCPIEGCGRHFSVVSNLRRHQKIHTEKKSKEIKKEYVKGEENA
ncbi:unnamed protein product [Rhizophagus irregularis]|nr:unnamed protein product [Rhizophagus irregularis]CAB5367053.1 unnamed protein product [Rhizophagus irregularis]